MSYLKYVRKYRFNSVLLRILTLSASFVLLINLVFGLAAYRQSISRIRTEITNTGVEVLRKIEGIVSSQYRSAVLATVGLAAAPGPSDLAGAYPTLTLFDRYRAIEGIRTKVTALAAENGLIESVYVYLCVPGLVIAPDSTLPLELFRDTGWRDALAATGSGGSLVTRTRRRYTSTTHGSVRGLSLVTSFPLGAREPEGAVIVNLDLGRLDEVLEQHRLPITEHVVIENEAGVLLAGGRPREADASVAAVHVADGAEWTYTAYTSKARLRGYLASFRRLTVLLVFGAVIAGALVAYVLALSAYRPFFRLHERFEPFLAGTEGAHDEIDFIEEGLGRTIRRNRELSALIRDNQLSLRSNFLHHLMTGAMQLPARSDLQDRLQLYGVSVDWDAPVVLVVVGLRPEQSGTTRAPEVTKMRAIETVGELAPDAVPFEWSRADVGVLLQSPEGHHGTVALCRQLLTRVGSAEFCAVSETGSGFADLPRLYGQVERALQYRFAMKDEVVFADSFTGARPHLDSQLTDQKRRIVFYMRHGNAAETCAAFEELWRQLDAYRLSTRHWRFVLLELLGAIELEVADLAGTDREDVPADQVELTSTISASYRLLYESDDLSLAPAQFRRIFEVAATLADKSRNSHHHRIVTEAIEFIARNYTRDISLDDVATSVGLSAPYLSKVFSRCKGEGFKEYISRLRVEKAIIMLQTTERPINSIYREIGFTNASTFYRVFKRYAGAAPEAFRVNLSAPPS